MMAERLLATGWEARTELGLFGLERFEENGPMSMLDFAFVDHSGKQKGAGCLVDLHVRK